MSALVDRITEVLRTEFAPLFEHVCMGPRTTEVACVRVAELIAAEIQPEITAELQRRYRQGAADNSWHMP